MSITEGLVPGTHPPIGTKMWERNYGMGRRVQQLKVVRHTPPRFYCKGVGETEYVYRVDNWAEVEGSGTCKTGRIQVVDNNDPVYQECLMEDACESLWFKAYRSLEKRPKLTGKNLELFRKITKLSEEIEL